MRGSIEKVLHASKWWQGDQLLEVGRSIFESLSADDRPQYALFMLDTLLDETGITCRVIENVRRVVRDRSGWPRAHDAFMAVRDVTLGLDELEVRSREQMILHHLAPLAELVAKVAYNATNPDDPFDADSGFWLPVCVKEVLDVLKDEQVSRATWSAIQEWLVKRITAGGQLSCQ
jgi:hypothetical protein